MARLRVFMTGTTGRVGSEFVAPFAERYDLRCLYRRPVPDAVNPVMGDLHDVDALRRGVEGADVVLHLAAVAGERPFLEELLPTNLAGAYNVFQAAHEMGVRRIVCASTC